MDVDRRSAGQTDELCRCREIDYPPLKSIPPDNIVRAKSIRGDYINYPGGLGYDMDTPPPLKKYSLPFHFYSYSHFY